jgi:hypothetical protein
MGIRDISSRVVAAASGYPPDHFRKLRNRGWMDGLGEKVGTTFYFSRDEALKIELAGKLAQSGMGLRTAFEVVRNPTPQVQEALAGRGEPLTFWPRRDNLDESADDLSSAVKIVIDAAAIVRAATVRLDAALEAQRYRNPRRRLSFAPRSVTDYRA